MNGQFHFAIVKGYPTAMERLGTVSDDSLKPVIDRFTAAHETLGAQRTRADAVRRPLRLRMRMVSTQRRTPRANLI